MIRRTPTLIALSDNDVQDVRDENKRELASLQAEEDAQNASIEEYKKAKEERKRQAALAKEQRLGLQWEPYVLNAVPEVPFVRVCDHSLHE